MRPKFLRVATLTALFAVMMVVGCSKPTPTTTATVETPGRRIAPAESVAKVFPHTEEFKTTVLHGAEFFKDKKICAQCHGIDFQGGGINKSCLNCHPYPHQPRWVFPTNHGHVFTTPGQQEACLQCHGEKSAFKERHGGEFVSCGTCHALLPHSEKFLDGRHGKLARTYEGKCTICHTDLKRNMPNNVEEGCYACHDPSLWDVDVPRDQWIPIMKWQEKPSPK